MTRSAWPTLLLLALATGVPAAGQPDAAAAPGKNIAVTIKIGRIETGRAPLEQSYRMVVRDGADIAQMLIGWRMPIPTGKTAGASDDAARTDYVYQNVGLTARFRVARTPAGPFAVDGELEVSGASKESLQPSTGGAPPVIGTFQQRLSVMLAPNAPLRVAEGPHPEGGTVFVELEAHGLD